MELIIEELSGTLASSIHWTRQEPALPGGIFAIREESPSIYWVEDPDVKCMEELSPKYGVMQHCFGAFLAGKTEEFTEGEVYGDQSSCIEIIGLPEEQLIQLAKEFLAKSLNRSLLVKVYGNDRILRIYKNFYYKARDKHFNLKSMAETLDLSKTYQHRVKGNRIAVLFPKLSGNYERVKAEMRQSGYVPQEREILSIRGREWLSVLFRFSDSKRLAGKYRNGDVVLIRSNQPGTHILRMFGHLSEEEMKDPLPMSEYVGEIFDDGGDNGQNRPFAFYSIRTMIPIEGFFCLAFEEDVIRLATEEDKKRLDINSKNPRRRI